MDQLGQFVSGDEKLFRWTGESEWVRYCPGKDDETGIWNYELCGRLPNKKSYLLYVRSHSAETSTGGGVQCASVMRDWTEIVREKSSQESTILTADSYYLDATSRNYMLDLAEEHGGSIPYLCAVQPCRFPIPATRANNMAHHAGSTAILYCEGLHEMFVTHWYPPPLSRKYVLTNAFTAEDSYPRTPTIFIPGTDHFSLMFNLCDKFNRSIHGKTWPYRCLTAAQQQYNFLLSCVLLNCYHVYLYQHNLTYATLSYKDFAISLADELFFYACGL